METGKPLSARLWRKYRKWLVLLVLAMTSYGLVKLYKEMTMPPPLVYLIPEEYFGPVFVFFGQADGVDVQSDPLGNAVWVPENGVVKIRQKVGEVVGESREGYRATYMISVTPDRKRKILKVNGDTQRDENGELIDFYFDENTRLHTFPANHPKDPFYFFTDAQKNERMVFNHDGCAHQQFAPTDSGMKSPACAKFLIATPNELVALPDFMWEDAQRYYGSIQEFVDEANERVKKKREYYHLPQDEKPSGQVEPQLLRATAGRPCPRTGTWQAQDTGLEKRFYKEGEIMADLHSAYGRTVWHWVE